MATDFSSLIYRCRVRHERLLPRGHKFAYGIYMLYLDLDQLPAMARDCKIFRIDRPGLVSFYQADHLKDIAAPGGEHIDVSAASLLNRLKSLVRSSGITVPVEKAYLLTMPRILGYVFNPVSFYFLFGENKTPVACVVEVGNTFGEMKTYILDGASLLRTEADNIYRLCVPKYFYVSPYGRLADKFDFILPLPDTNLRICINTVSGDDESVKVLTSSLSGSAQPFSESLLLSCFWRYPLVTLKVIGLIHLHALFLLVKKVPFYRKEEYPELQRDVLNVRPNGLSKEKKTSGKKKLHV